MISGLLFTIAACFCWSLVFIIPSLITGFSSLEIALGRFFVYGFLCFSYTLLKRRSLFSYTHLPHWKTAISLSFLSTILCYTAVVLNIQYAGPTIATLIFSMTPITIPLIGNFYKKEMSFQTFILPLSCILIGILLTKLSSLEVASTPPLLYFLGIFSGLIGVFSWTFFSILNAEFLKKNKTFPLVDWFLMLGSSTFFLVLLISAIFLPFLINTEKYLSHSIELYSFIHGSLLLGTISTALPFYLWMQGAKKLPVSLTGQLMVFEIIFALFLLYLLNEKSFSFTELGGIILMIMGVLISFRKRKNKITEL